MSEDSQKFDNRPYSRKIEKPWGWEIHWVPDGMPYMGKVLHINEGHKISLQYHDEKQESWYLLLGRAKIIWEGQGGELEECEMEMGVGYTVDLKQRHRLVGITDCEVMEVSSPEKGNTVREDDDYGRKGKTEDAEEREKRNKGEI